MIKSLIGAAVLTIGLAGYAVAQEAAPAPAPGAPATSTAPAAPMTITIIITTTTIITITITMHAAHAAACSLGSSPCRPPRASRPRARRAAAAMTRRR